MKVNKLARGVVAGLIGVVLVSCGGGSGDGGGGLPVASAKFLLLDGTTEKDFTSTPIPRGVKVRVTFDRALTGDERTDLEGGVTLARGSTNISMTFEWASDYKSVVITPTGWFEYGTTYTVGISGTVATGVSDTNFTTAVKGDVNGDGYADFIVGAPASVGGNNKGKAYIIHGSANGIGNTDLSTTVPNTKITGASDGDYMGDAVSLMGDFNSDGYADAIVGADGAANGEGQAYLLYGSANGISNCDRSGDPQCAPNYMIAGENANDSLGCKVAYAGDVNGDGFDDVIVGAVGYNTSAGRAYIVHGASSFADSWVAASEAPTIFTGATVDDHLGNSVASAGDINGDGYDDVIVGAPKVSSIKGAAYVFLGSATGISSCDLSAGCTPTATIGGATAGDWLGYSVGPGGDVNGDSYSDIIAGALAVAGGGTARGAAYIFHGSANGITDCDLGGSCSAATTVTGSANYDDLGNAVFGAGDVNGDGYNDVLIGALFYGGVNQKGRVYLFLGSSNGIADCNLSGGSCTADTTFTGAASEDDLGWDVSTAGDVNGDGYDDISMTAYGSDGGGTNRGRAYIFHGSTAGIADCDLGGSCTPNAVVTGEDDGDRLNYVR